MGTGLVETLRSPLTGTATAFYIHWKVQVASAAATDTSHYENFTLKLTPSGAFSVTYGTMDGTSGGNAGATVGYSSGDGVDYANVGGLDQGVVATNAPSAEVQPHASSVIGPSTFDGLDRLSPDLNHTFNSAGDSLTVGSASYGYDGRGLMTSASTGSTADVLGYDGESRQVTDTVNGTTTRIRYTAAGDAGAAFQTDAAGNLLNYYVTGPTGLLATYGPNGTGAVFPATDPHGSSAALVDGSGSVVSRVAYDEFGNPEWQNGAPVGALGYLASNRKRTEAGAGVVVMGLRGYAPLLGRFLQRDPVEGGSANAYDYVNQDPVDGYDLDGRFLGRFGNWVADRAHDVHRGARRVWHAAKRFGGWIWNHKASIIGCAGAAWSTAKMLSPLFEFGGFWGGLAGGVAVVAACGAGAYLGSNPFKQPGVYAPQAMHDSGYRRDE